VQQNRHLARQRLKRTHARGGRVEIIVGDRFYSVDAMKIGEDACRQFRSSAEPDAVFNCRIHRSRLHLRSLNRMRNLLRRNRQTIRMTRHKTNPCSPGLPRL
jgi:hypothetical protein